MRAGLGPSSLSGVHSSPDALCVLLLEPRFDVGASVADSVADLEAWWSAVAAVSVETQGGPRDSGHFRYLFEKENVGHVVLLGIAKGYLTWLSLGNASHLCKHDRYLYVMPVENKETPERQAGAKIKARRMELGMSQEQLSDEMRRLGHSWHQTTVVKTEAAGRPLRLNELTDLARILGVRASHLAATETDFKLEMIQNDVVAHSGAAARLKTDIDELARQLEEKTQAYENAQRLLRESQEHYSQLINDLGER
jgi:transcriptional regulator with XRE-family HTH domain